MKQQPTLVCGDLRERGLSENVRVCSSMTHGQVMKIIINTFHTVTRQMSFQYDMHGSSSLIMSMEFVWSREPF